MNFSILEILISFSLLSIVMLSAGMMNLSSLQTAQSSYDIAAATQQLVNLDDFLQHARDDTNTFIQTWKLHTAAMLPQGQGELQGAYPDYRIVVSWGGKASASCRHNTTGKQGCLVLQR